MNFTEKDIENCKKIYSKLSEKKFNKLLKKQDELNLSNNLRSTLQKIRLNGGSYDMIPNIVDGSRQGQREAWRLRPIDARGGSVRHRRHGAHRPERHRQPRRHASGHRYPPDQRGQGQLQGLRRTVHAAHGPEQHRGRAEGGPQLLRRGAHLLFLHRQKSGEGGGGVGG